MKTHLLIILTFASIACNPNSSRNNSVVEIENVDVKALEKNGFKVFQENPEKAIPIFKKVALEYQHLKDFKKTAITNLNIANIYDEHLNKIDSSLIYAERSLHIWKENNDSLQMANLYKYIGLLKGKLSNFEEAKSSINEALKIYKENVFEEGIAVSEINLANVYFRMKDYKECEVLFIKSNVYWQKANDESRIYTNNILGIQLYDKIGHKKEAQRLINDNMEIEKRIELNEFNKRRFHKLIKERTNY